MTRRSLRAAAAAALVLGLAAWPAAAQRNGGVATGGGVSTSQANTWSQAQTFAAGLSSSATDPTLSADPTDLWLLKLGCTYDMAQSTPAIFGDQNCLEIAEAALQGQNSYGNGTNAKQTYLPLRLTGTYYASGQRFALGETVNGFGMGDLFAESRAVTFAGGPISGDEGQGFQSVSTLEQQGSLTLTTIAAVPVRTACSTTVTPGITAAASAQTVAVASTTGCNVGDWLVVQEEAATNTPNHEAVKLTAVGSGTVSAIFRNNHSAGATLTPALVLTVASGANFGQGRVLVDLSGASYATGTVSSISGKTLTGSGTTWAAGMVGGAAPDVGCIALTADDYAGAPFNGTGAQGTLKSWYQVQTETDATHLDIYRTSTAASGTYVGKGPGTGGYIVRPCAEVLYVTGVGSNATIVLETSAATWTNGDTVELAIAPYPDVTGYQYQIGAWTPGGTYRTGLAKITNVGARQFAAAIDIASSLATGSNADTTAWGTGLLIEQGAAQGIEIDSPTSTGISINTPASGQDAIIASMGTGTGIAYYATGTATSYTGFQSTGGGIGADLGGATVDLQLANGSLRVGGSGTAFTFDASGDLAVHGWGTFSAGAFNLGQFFGGQGALAGSGAAWGWSSQAVPVGGSFDTGLVRAAAGEVQLCGLSGSCTVNGTGDGVLRLTRVKLTPTTVAALPTCNAGLAGSIALVSDATAPTYNGSLTGGGAVEIPVLCNGTAWTAH